MNPALKPPPIQDRQIVAVEDRGVLQGLGNSKVLLDSFFDRGIKRCLITDGEPTVTGWWLLRMRSGLRIVYFGTEESFVEFQRTGQGHCYEFGRNGKLQ